MLFADWASGVSCTLDPETVNKHITAMVEAVFKNYDHNKDNFISENEFQQISTNFPFIAPFRSIDTDKYVFGISPISNLIILFQISSYIYILAN